MTASHVPSLGRWRVPDTWSWTRVHEVATVIGGGTPKNASDDSNYDEGGTPWVTPADLSGYTATYIRRGRRNLSEVGLRNSSARLLPRGAVLFSSRAPVGYCAVAANTVTTNQGFKSLVLRHGLIPEYVRYYLLASRQYCQERASGTTFKELSGAAVEQLEIPVAPTAEQRRMVAKIEELFGEIEAGEQELEKAREGLAAYRRAVLKAAVTGDLTRDRREKDSKPHALLPDTWTLASLAQLITEAPRNGISVKGSPNPPGTPALRLDALTDAGLDWSCRRYIEIPAVKRDALLIRAGDFLVSRANGSMRFLARACLITEPPEPIVFPDTMIRFRIGGDPILRRWVDAIWQSPVVRRQIEKRGKTTAGIWKVSQEDLLEVMLPLPPIDEMGAILEKMGTLLAASDEGNGSLNSLRRDGATLRQSILSAAFHGRLVPQGQSDEPARLLLDRIRASGPQASRAHAPKVALRARRSRKVAVLVQGSTS